MKKLADIGHYRLPIADPIISASLMDSVYDLKQREYQTVTFTGGPMNS